MKTARVILILSAAANVCLGAVWLLRSPANVAPPPVVEAKSATPAKAPAPVEVRDNEIRAALQADDDQTYVNRLRAAGFPAHMIVALMSERLRERYADRMKEFRPKTNYAYWKESPYNFLGEESLTPEQRTARRALQREMNDQLEKLIGQEMLEANPWQQARRTRLYGNLDSAKIEQIETLDKDYNELSAQMKKKIQGLTLPEDRERMVALEKEKRADLEKVLTPEELREYDLRASPSASTVRSQLRYFQPTENEYRAITALQLAFDQTYGQSNRLSGAQGEKRTAALTDLKAQIKELLGPERYADYDITTDGSYGSVYSLTQGNNLPASAARDVVQVKRDITARANAIRSNTALSPEQRDLELGALANEATSKLTTTLGATAYAQYEKGYGDGGWLRNLKPKNR